MSQAPYALRDARFGTRLGVDLKLEDTLWAGLTDQYIKLPMGITAENLAEKVSFLLSIFDFIKILVQPDNGRC